MYGGSIQNEGIDDQFRSEDFVNSYQNEEATGKKQFIILWLHAYKYTYKQLTVETDVPHWARPEYRLPKSKKLSATQNSNPE